MLSVPGSNSRFRARSGKSCSSLRPSLTILDIVSKWWRWTSSSSLSSPSIRFSKGQQRVKVLSKHQNDLFPSATCFFNPYDPLIGLVSWNSPPCSGFCSMIVVEKADSSKCQACWSPLRKILIEQAPRGSALCCSQWQFFVHSTYILG